MDSTDVVHQRLFNQRLIGVPHETPESAVEWMCAVQAQDYPGARWAMAQRVQHDAQSTTDEAYRAGKILRTHVMRPTWHFVTPADIRWLLELTAPRVHAVNGSYYRKLELDQAVLNASETILVKALEGNRHLTRAEVAVALKAGGITATALRLGYILMHAELNAIICSGAMKGKQHTYALLDERVPNGTRRTREEALVALARRYFTSHGPAQLHDFAWWSGLTVADARLAVSLAGSGLVQVNHDAHAHWAGSEPVAVSRDVTVHLLPNYDEYFIAYKDRSAYSTPFIVTPPAAIFDRHILVISGKVAGAWRADPKGKSIVVTATPLVALGGAEQDALRDAVERYGDFIGSPVELVLGKA